MEYFIVYEEIKNFPLRYFYGESTNAISGLATIVRIMLMYYIYVMGGLEHPEKDWEVAVENAISSPV